MTLPSSVAPDVRTSYSLHIALAALTELMCSRRAVLCALLHSASPPCRLLPAGCLCLVVGSSASWKQVSCLPCRVASLGIALHSGATTPSNPTLLAASDLKAQLPSKACLARATSSLWRLFWREWWWHVPGVQQRSRAPRQARCPLPVPRAYLWQACLAHPPCIGFGLLAGMVQGLGADFIKSRACDAPGRLALRNCRFVAHGISVSCCRDLKRPCLSCVSTAALLRAGSAPQAGTRPMSSNFKRQKFCAEAHLITSVVGSFLNDYDAA